MNCRLSSFSVKTLILILKGIQGDGVPLADSKGGAFGGVWGNAPT